MMTKQREELNLFDPVEIELEQLGQLQITDIELDFNDPHVARFLAQQLIVRLHDLRASIREGKELRDDAKALHSEIAQLRVDKGVLQERGRISLIEFPAGVLCGVAGNLVAADFKNFFAWVLMVIGLTFFLAIRIPQILDRRREGHR